MACERSLRSVSVAAAVTVGLAMAAFKTAWERKP
jgi:hypothetical protein